MKRRNTGLLRILVFVIIFVMMFSVIGVVVVYLRGLATQREARQQVIDKQAQYQDQQVTNTGFINIPKIEVNTGNKNINIKIGDQSSSGLVEE